MTTPFATAPPAAAKIKDTTPASAVVAARGVLVDELTSSTPSPELVDQRGWNISHRPPPSAWRRREP